MEPCVDPISKVILELVEERRQMNYVEIGVAEGRTLAGIGRLVNSKRCHFFLFGVDIKNGWSLDLPAVRNVMDQLSPCAGLSLDGSIAFLENLKDSTIDFILVDGCHGEACVLADLNALYSKLRKGGVACFHDSDVACQGLDVQPHCGRPIEVRSALTKAGLLDGSNKDWELVLDLNPVTEGRGCVMVRKL